MRRWLERLLHTGVVWVAVYPDGKHLYPMPYHLASEYVAIFGGHVAHRDDVVDPRWAIT